MQLRRAGSLFVVIASRLSICLLAMSGDADGAPLDLGDVRPRGIEVRFEISPSDEPGRLDSSWSPPRPARLEPTEDPAHVRIRIAAAEMEDHLRSTGTAVVPGTFSDFVWTLDRSSGHVLDARLEGRIEERLSIGLLETRVPVRIHVDMSTTDTAGYRRKRAPFGIETHDFCSPGAGEGPCIAVAGRRYDAARGYVNAVGSIRASTPMVEVRAFSPLGEARFSEPDAMTSLEPRPTTPSPEAVSSADRGPLDAPRPGGWHGEASERREADDPGRRS